MTQLTDKHWAVAVPEDLLSPEFCFEQSIVRMLDGEKGDDELVIRHRERSCGSPIGKITIPIPPGTWCFLFTTGTATEEDARTVVERYGKGWKDYNIYHAHKHIPYGLAIDSLETLLRSKGLDENKNYAIIEKL
jgi:hypothetical protein